jgi:hypothetical protein
VRHTLQENQRTRNSETVTTAVASCLVRTAEGELSICKNEMIQPVFILIWAPCMGRLLILDIYYFLVGLTSLLGSSILLYYLCGTTSLPGNYISTLFFYCGSTSLLWCYSTVQWSSFDFLESSSSQRKFVQEGIPPATTKKST